jgi:hypothetical protein
MGIICLEKETEAVDAPTPQGEGTDVEPDAPVLEPLVVPVLPPAEVPALGMLAVPVLLPAPADAPEPVWPPVSLPAPGPLVRPPQAAAARNANPSGDQRP